MDPYGGLEPASISACTDLDLWTYPGEEMREYVFEEDKEVYMVDNNRLDTHSSFSIHELSTRANEERLEMKIFTAISQVFNSSIDL